MSAIEVSMPYLIEDGDVLHRDVTLEGSVDLETREVTGIRATDDHSGLEIDIPEDALGGARGDLIEAAEGTWGLR